MDKLDLEDNYQVEVHRAERVIDREKILHCQEWNLEEVATRPGLESYTSPWDAGRKTDEVQHMYFGLQSMDTAFAQNFEAE